VSDPVFGLLLDHDLLLPAAADRLRDDRAEASRLLPRLGRVLRPDTVLVVLLPSPNELADEVILYCRVLSSPRVLFLAESAYFDEDDVADIVRSLETWVPPVTLSVGRLDSGDAQRFVRDRLERHRERFSYPDLAEDAVELLARLCQSIAMLQGITHGVYERWLHTADPIADPGHLTVDDIRALFRENAGASG
jgi:hypothetical protein